MTANWMARHGIRVDHLGLMLWFSNGEGGAKEVGLSLLAMATIAVLYVARGIGVRRSAACRVLTELSASLHAKLLKQQKHKRLILIHSKPGT